MNCPVFNLLPACTLAVYFFIVTCGVSGSEPAGGSAQPTQLREAMHIPMKKHAFIRVGVDSGDLRGNDNRALQAAVDFVAGLGGGVVEIGPGEYVMRDSLHLRPNVTVRGSSQRTVLRKAPSAASALKVDGDYGEEQFTIKDAKAFAVGD